MLSNDVIRKLNRQIEDELRTVDSHISNHAEKMEALERIAKLKELLTPQPSRQDILSELATALVEKRDQDRRPGPLNDAFDQFARLFTTR